MKKLFLFIALAIATATTAGNSNNTVVYFNSESNYYHISSKCTNIENGRLMLGFESTVKHDHVLCPLCAAEIMSKNFTNNLK